MTPKSILLVRLKSIGEVVMCLSVVEAIRRQWPETRSGFMVEPPHEQLLLADSRIDHVHVLDRKGWLKAGPLAILKGALGFWKELRTEKYEFVADLHGVERSQVLCRLAGGRRRVGRISNYLTNRLMHKLVPMIWDGRHNVELLFDIMEPLGLKRDIPAPRLMLSDSARTVAQGVLDFATPL